MTTPEGDRRWTALLSADMVGSTQAAHDLGPEKAFGLIARALDLARLAIEAEGGQVVDTAGDGILAAFGAPRALENASLQACRAALRFRDALQDQAAPLMADYGVAPQFRMGIAGGNAMVAHLPEGGVKIIGDPVHAATRLQEAAAPGSILISDEIDREASGFLRVQDLAPIDAKGFSEPLACHQILGLAETTTTFEGVRRRGVVDLVSRRAELDQALAALAEPTGVVLIHGPAGIGKSRLVHEITTSLSATRAAFVGQCHPIASGQAYGPVLDILRQIGGAPWGAGRAETLKAVFDVHPDLHDPAAAARFVEARTQPEHGADRALDDRDFLAGLLQGVCTALGCLLVIEDVHWIDAATNALIAKLVQSGAPLLATSRPGFNADWFQAAKTTRIALPPLDQTEIRQIAEAQLGGRLSDALAQLIGDRAEGVPLIAEEITRALRQESRLHDPGTGFVLTEDAGQLLTGNLEQLVLSRVDRLSPSQRETLQIAAAIGRDFDATLLTAALGKTPDLAGIAAEPGLIEDRGAGQWRFDHALIRDAVYDGLLTPQRQASHARIAAALEKAPEAQPYGWGVLADHCLRTDTPERSVPFLVKAAGDSLRAYNMYEVDALLDRAMGFLETDPDLIDDDGFRDLAHFWLRALDQIGDFGRVEKIGARVIPRLERAGYAPALSIVRTLTAVGMAHTRDYEDAEALALRTLERAEAEADQWGAAWSKIALMRIYDETGWRGLSEIERLAHEIMPVADATGDRHLAMMARYMLCAGYRSAGYKRKAFDIADQIGAFAETENDRRARSFATWARAILYSLEANPEKAMETIAPARADAVPGAADDRVSAGIELFAATFLRPPDEVRPKVQHMIDEARALADHNILHSMEWIMALLELKSGHLAKGWRSLANYIDETKKAGNVQFVRQGAITRAEFLLTIAGLVDPAAEAPPERPVFPRKRPGIRDLALFLTLKPRALKLAERDLHRCIALDPEKHGAHFTRATIGLGLIAAARGDRETAIQHLETGHAEALSEDLDVLAMRAMRALSALGVTPVPAANPA